MNDKRDTGEGGEGGEVVDLARAGERARRLKQDRAADELATRFHRAMGWKGTPDKPAGKKRKAKRPKKR